MISVIIPVYNNENDIERCIKSALSQQNVEVQVIVVDDGSTDGTAKIVDNYASKNGNLICIHKENGGASTARNIGLDKAEGEYIFFLDGDDYIEQDALYQLYNAAIVNDVDMVISNFCTRDAKGNLIKKFEIPMYAKDKKISEYDYWKLNAEDSTYITSVVWTKLYRRKLWDTVRFPEGIIHEDEFVQAPLVNNCSGIFVLDKVLYNQCLSDDSVMRRPFNYKNLASSKARAERTKYLMGKGYYDMALYNFGFGTRMMILGKNSLKDKKSREEIARQYKEYKSIAKELSKYVGSKDKIRLLLFRMNLYLYEKIRLLMRG